MMVGVPAPDVIVPPLKVQAYVAPDPPAGTDAMLPLELTQTVDSDVITGLARFVCETPSDQRTVHGPVPVKAAWIFVLFPKQIVPPPLTIAVGKGKFVMVLVQVLLQPLLFVSVIVRVKVPEAPALTLTV